MIPDTKEEDHVKNSISEQTLTIAQNEKEDTMFLMMAEDDEQELMEK